jgi:hypothetical protein
MKSLATTIIALGTALAGVGCSVDVDGAADAADAAELGEVSAELAAKSSTLWTPVYGDTDTNISLCFAGAVTSSEKSTIQTHAAVWETLSATQGVTFSFQDCPLPFLVPGAVPIYVREFTGSGDTSANYAQGLGTDCTKIVFDKPITKYAVVHELGHLLGFSHEQNRTDSTCTIADQGTYGDLGITLNDDNSIMSYCGPNNGSLTSTDMAGFRGVYGGATIPTSGTALLGIRNAAGSPYPFMRVTDSGTPLAMSTGIGGREKFRLRKHSGSSGSNLENGDVVYIQNARYSTYLRASSSGTVEGSTTQDSRSRWTVVRRITGAGNVLSQQEVSFRSTYGKYLTYNPAIFSVTANASSTGNLANWRILVLPLGADVN